MSAGTFRGEYRINGGAWQLATDAIGAGATSFPVVIPQTSVSQSVEFQVKRNDVNGYSSPSSPLTIPAVPPTGDLPPEFTAGYYSGNKNWIVFEWHVFGGAGDFVIEYPGTGAPDHFLQLTTATSAQRTKNVSFPHTSSEQIISFRIKRNDVGYSETIWVEIPAQEGVL